MDIIIIAMALEAMVVMLREALFLFSACAIWRPAAGLILQALVGAALRVIGKMSLIGLSAVLRTKQHFVYKTLDVEGLFAGVKEARLKEVSPEPVGGLAPEAPREFLTI